MRCGMRYRNRKDYDCLNAASTSVKNLWGTSRHLELLDAFRRRNAHRVEKAIVADIRRTVDYLIGEVVSGVRSCPLATLAAHGLSYITVN
jgi:DNA-binding GntR family transcriptional regulator